MLELGKVSSELEKCENGESVRMNKYQIWESVSMGKMSSSRKVFFGSSWKVSELGKCQSY